MKIGDTFFDSVPANADNSFLSNPDKGIIQYVIPSLEDIVGSSAASTISSLTPELSMIGQNLAYYACSNSSNCQVKYDLKYTPQIYSIYPSTVYAGQDICAEVFTDQATYAMTSYNVSGSIGKYSINFEDYVNDNQAATNTYTYYQVCGKAGGNIATDSSDLTLTSWVGDYWNTDFSKSFDGDSEYTVRSIPSVNSVSTNTLYQASGAIITVKGDGFSPFATENTVTVDGLDCSVLSSTQSEIVCQLPENASPSTATEFVGGTGAREYRYLNTYISQINADTVPSSVSYFTDIESRRNVEDDRFTRSLEYWFVPPQTGNYTFHAACDDYCSVSLSTTDMDSSAATQILSIGYDNWRNFWSPYQTITAASSYELTEGNHYYMKVMHQDGGGDEHMTIGFTIEDDSTPVSNSQRSWKRLRLDGNHTFEEYQVVVPNTANVNYRVSWNSCTALATADAFACTTTKCPCVSSSFSKDSSESTVQAAFKPFFESIRANYGYYGVVVKDLLDVDGNPTNVTADQVSTRFTWTGRLSRSTPSATTVRIYSNNTSVTTATAALTQNSTIPLSGQFKILYTDSDSNITSTEDLQLYYGDGLYMRKFIEANPQFLGKIQFRRDYKTFVSYTEGVDLYYQTLEELDNDLEIVSSDAFPVVGGSSDGVLFTTEDSVVASNKPFYKFIPAQFVRSYEEKAQVIVTSNGLTSACPIENSCDITFITDVGEITNWSVDEYNQFITFTGTGLPYDTLTYVDVGTFRRCEIDSDLTATETTFGCDLKKLIAGTHTLRAQTTTGAIANADGLADFDLDIVISSVSPTTIYSTGGQVMTIVGNYFPWSLFEAQSLEDWSVSFTGDFECKVTSVTQTKIVCISPEGLTGTPQITVSFNGKSTTYATTFTLNDVTQEVTGIDKPSICAVQKQNVVITVSDTPSSDPNDYRAIIIANDYEIFMRVNSVDTDAKTLTARFPGTPDLNEYYVYVEYFDGTDFMRYNSNTVLNTNSTVSTIEITTSGDAKTEISTTGGDLITITGVGYSTNPDNHVVVIGTNIADIVSSSDTQIVVRAPPSDNAASAEVIVYLKPNLLSI